MRANNLGLLGKAVFLVTTILFETGCGPYLLHEIGVEGSDSKFSAAQHSFPIPESKNGRLFVYLTGEPNMIEIFGGIGKPKMYGDYTIDDLVFHYLSGSYCYEDIPEGNHRVATEHGKRTLEVYLNRQENAYVRIDLSGIGEFATASPVLVDPEVAAKEISGLRRAKYCKDYSK